MGLDNAKSDLVLLSSHNHQRGAVLVVSILILFVLSILAITSMQGTLMQEKMVEAQRDGYVALETGQIAMLQAQQALAAIPVPTLAAPSPFVVAGNNGFYDGENIGNAPVGAQLFQAVSWAPAVTQAAPMPLDAAGNPVLAEPPRYFIERLGQRVAATPGGGGLNMGNDAGGDPGLALRVFRTVVRTTGATGQTQRVLEQYVMRVFD